MDDAQFYKMEKKIDKRDEPCLIDVFLYNLTITT